MQRRNPVLETTEYVVERSKHVRLKDDAIVDFCNRFKPKQIKHWFEEAPFNLQSLPDRDKLHFLVVFNAVSFSYWGDPKWTIEYDGKPVDGAYGLIACLARALDAGTPVTDFSFLRDISDDAFAEITRGNVVIPLFDERLAILRELGTTMTEQFDGEFSAMLKCSNDALGLMEAIVTEFPSFADTAEYNGKKIVFNKRAQLLIADIHQAFLDQEANSVEDISQLTACADYKLPMILRHEGILEYDEQLSDTVDDQKEIPHGSAEEVEIRANTIWAVERIKQCLRAKLPEIDSIHVNDAIWLQSQIKNPASKPYHHTRTTAY